MPTCIQRMRWRGGGGASCWAPERQRGAIVQCTVRRGMARAAPRTLSAERSKRRYHQTSAVCAGTLQSNGSRCVGRLAELQGCMMWAAAI